MKVLVFILCLWAGSVSGQNISIGMKTLIDNITGYSSSPHEFYDPAYNPNPHADTGTLVYLNRNDRITIAKKAQRISKTTITETSEGYMIMTTDTRYVTKYRINVPEDAVIIFKVKKP